MAKGFSKNNPLDKLSGAKVTPTVAVPDEEPKAAVEPKKEPKKENKEPRKEAVKEPKKEVKKDAPKPPKKENNKPAEKEVVKEAVKESAVKEAPVKKETKQEVKKEEKKPVVRTDEQVAAMKRDAEKFLAGVFKAMELPVNIQIVYDKENDSLDINFDGEDMGILIGKRGQTLDSLQYLTSLVVNKEQENYVRVKLDTEDYRSRRKDTLENLARNIAFKVRKTRKAVVDALLVCSDVLNNASD